MLSISNLNFYFGSRALYENANLHIKPKTKIGLVGANGTGKSTLLRLISGEYSPDGGNISKSGECTIGFLNQDLLSYQTDESILHVAMQAFERQLELQKNIDVVLHKMETNYEDKDVDELSKYQEEFERLDGYTIQSRTEEILEGLGFTTEDLTRPLRLFSGGWRMRVMLAKLLLQKPALLLLDEPTSGLDPNQLIEIREVIKQLSKHSMILFSSHILQEVTAVCSRVLVMHQGRLVANEPMEELLKPKTNHLHILFEEELTHLSAHIATLSLDIVSIDKHLLVVKTAEGKDVKKIVMQFALDMGLNIERLHTEEASLEEIFKLLTH
jgi:ATP-binding cassette subfamily F protein 3